MSIIPQPSLFSWENVERSPEIVRLRRLLDDLPDERLLDALEAKRNGKRNDYPLRPLWRASMAQIALGHAHTSTLIRELRRNAELREVCGFDVLAGERAVPPDYVFSRFGKRLDAHPDLVREMFKALVAGLGEILAEFGKDLAVDSKALVARCACGTDADQGTKRYESVDKDGTLREQITHWVGWKLHLVVDADTELPVSYEVTEASAGDSPRLVPLVEDYQKEHPTLAERGETVSADKAYDDGADKARLYERDGLVPVIPPRDTTATRAGDGMQALDPARHDTIYLGATGEVCCRIAPFEPDPAKAYAPMQFLGYEKDRDAFKFRCPAVAYGIDCDNRAACRCRPTVREGRYGRIVRVARRRDPRTLLPIHPHSRNFAKAYKKRTSVERTFSRLDGVHGFDAAIVRSRKRMETRIGLALISMLATARSWIEHERPEHMRRILCAA